MSFSSLSSSSLSSLPGLDLPPGGLPVLAADAAGDAPGWAAGHRDALRAVVAEHGCVMVRGLGLADAAEAVAVLQRLATDLMAEKEAFASRRTYPGGVYSSSKWPPNQPMCMHHELSYAIEFPGLMLFACLTRAASRRGDRRGRRAGRARRAARRPGRAVRARGLAADPQLQRGHRGVRGRGVRHRRPGRGRELLPGERDRVRVAARRRPADQAGAQRRARSPGHRPALLVQPGRVPQRADDRPGDPRVPGGHLRRRGAAVQHPFRRRRPDRRGRGGVAQRGLRGAHRARAVAGRRPAAGGQPADGAQPGSVRGTA